jgi:hypothetical protein
MSDIDRNSVDDSTSENKGSTRSGSGGKVEERAARADEGDERPGQSGDEGSTASRPHGRTEDPDRTL